MTFCFSYLLSEILACIIWLNSCWLLRRLSQIHCIAKNTEHLLTYLFAVSTTEKIQSLKKYEAWDGHTAQL
jgi:hypothetical protein